MSQKPIKIMLEKSPKKSIQKSIAIAIMTIHTTIMTIHTITNTPPSQYSQNEITISLTLRMQMQMHYNKHFVILMSHLNSYLFARNCSLELQH